MGRRGTAGIAKLLPARNRVKRAVWSQGAGPLSGPAKDGPDVDDGRYLWIADDAGGWLLATGRRGRHNLPPRRNEDEMRILIVGAGPTGLAAALFLAERGLSARVVDRRVQPTTRSKAFGVNPRSLSLLSGTGAAEEMLARGRRLTHVSLWRESRRIARLDLRRGGGPHPFMLVLPQAESEAILESALAKRGVLVERGVEARRVSEAAPGAECELHHPGGRVETIVPDVLLGADGVASTVRRGLGIELEGTAFPEPWRLYDLEMKLPLADEAHAVLLPDGALFIIRIAGDVWRVVGNVEDPLARLPSGAELGPVRWESEFRIAHRVAARFQAGTACLAGDAAHVHSPLGARGMNLGIEDAYVFASLAATGRLGDYERLRLPVDRRVVRVVRLMTEVPRGRSVLARLARRAAPLGGRIIPLLGLHRWILGLDHPLILE